MAITPSGRRQAASGLVAMAVRLVFGRPGRGAIDPGESSSLRRSDRLAKPAPLPRFVGLLIRRFRAAVRCGQSVQRRAAEHGSLARLASRRITGRISTATRHALARWLLTTIGTSRNTPSAKVSGENLCPWCARLLARCCRIVGRHGAAARRRVQGAAVAGTCGRNGSSTGTCSRSRRSRRRAAPTSSSTRRKGTWPPAITPRSGSRTMQPRTPISG